MVVSFTPLQCGSQIKFETLTPSNLLKHHQISRIDYLSIDTAGTETVTLNSFDSRNIHVAIIDVENGKRSPEVFRHLTSVGYELAVCVGCDEIYRRVPL
jgi:hypothetical protein